MCPLTAAGPRAGPDIWTVKIQLLPSTFQDDGTASPGQHLTCFIVNDRIAIDAGSLGMAAGSLLRKQVRDVILSHAHLDHIAGLPIFIDDLFATLDGPIRVHAEPKVIGVLESCIFNWSVYPDFAELSNSLGSVLEYVPFNPQTPFAIGDLEITPISVNHKVPSCGFVVSDGGSTIALSGDTAEVNTFWEFLAGIERLDALFVECAFPNEMSELAAISHHLTPVRLKNELVKLGGRACPIYCINLKPMYRQSIIDELSQMNVPGLSVLEVGRAYEF